MKSAKPWLIQRLESVSKNRDVRFSERFNFDYMGSSYFETGRFAQMIRMLDGKELAVGEFPFLDNNGRRFFVQAIWPVDTYDTEGVEAVLRQIWDSDVDLEEPAYFNLRRYVESKEGNGRFTTNAWVDIENGLFWTWEKINVRDIERNYQFSLKYMEELWEASAKK